MSGEARSMATSAKSDASNENAVLVNQFYCRCPYDSHDVVSSTCLQTRSWPRTERTNTAVFIAPGR